LNNSTALVFGGSGYVGSKVLAGLAKAGIPTTFTYFQQSEKARLLAGEFSQRAYCLNVREPDAIRKFLSHVGAESVPSIFIHCIAQSQDRSLKDITDADWDDLYAVNVRSAFVACQEITSRMAANGGGNIVLTAGLDSIKPIPSSVHVGASQGALAGMTRALARALGPQAIRVNLVAIGVLEGGMSERLNAALRDNYERLSAMGRVGTAEEAAKAILWLALHNTYMTGATLTVDGGY
jgi:3-oxoacyl-[acyl-carrier protein] reductase